MNNSQSNRVIEPLNAAQQALIAALAYAERYALPVTGALPCRDIEEYGDSYFGMYRLKWQSCFNALESSGQLAFTGDAITLTPAGVALANRLRKDHPKHRYAYNEFFYRARRSVAHSQFCERVFGRDLCQHGMMDMAQLDALVDLLRAQGAEKILELGCGNGAIAGYIAEQCGAHVTGVDLAKEGIRWAKEIAAAKPEQLQFVCDDMLTLDFPTESFEAVLLVDAIYFVPDMTAFTRRVLTFLRPGGKLYVYFSAWVDDTAKREHLKVQGTPFASALRELGLDYAYLNYSAGEGDHWRIKREIAEEMKAEFEAEGNGWLQHRRWIEAHCHQPYVEEGNISRYLYMVEKEL